MKKYILGGLVGFLLATAVSANAEGVSKMIGEVIDGAFSVKVNGVELSDQAIVVQGTSYLPVRSFGEATGYDIKFNPEMGIELTKKDDTTAPIEPVATPQPNPTPTPSTKPTKEEIEKKIGYYNSQIRIANIDIGIIEDNIKQTPDKTTEFQKQIETLKSRITDYQAQIAALEAQK